MCTFSAKFAFDTTATYERTNRCKTTNVSRTHLDITCAESGLESPPFSQMSSMLKDTVATGPVHDGVGRCAVPSNTRPSTAVKASARSAHTGGSEGRHTVMNGITDNKLSITHAALWVMMAMGITAPIRVLHFFNFNFTCFTPPCPPREAGGFLISPPTSLSGISGLSVWSHFSIY